MINQLKRILCILLGGHHKVRVGGLYGYIKCVACPYRTKGFYHLDRAA